VPGVRVAFYNNYDMRLALERHERGDYAGHHLWGTLVLRDRGHQLVPLANDRFPRLARFTGPRIGDLDVQLRVLADQRRHDVVLSGTEYDSVVLGLLRRLGIYRRPLVAIVHAPPRPPFERPWLGRLAFGAHDRLLFLSSGVRDRFLALGIDPARTGVVSWGLDLDYYGWAPLATDAWKQPYVLSAGKTRRDHLTLVKGFTDAPIELRLYCSESSAPPASVTPPNAHVHYAPDGHDDESEALTDAELHAAYRGCVAVAIPLGTNGALAGLTSLLEAMAMGRAVIVTRNPFFDIDVAAEGAGLVVEPGDVDGWHRALEWIVAHPDETTAMGERGRQLCEERYNLAAFSSQIADAIEAVAASTASTRRRRRHRSG
jgi:glycosyltransferase involved in cell wall biosynthesis